MKYLFNFYFSSLFFIIINIIYLFRMLFKSPGQSPKFNMTLTSILSFPLDRYMCFLQAQAAVAFLFCLYDRRIMEFQQKRGKISNKKTLLIVSLLIFAIIVSIFDLDLYISLYDYIKLRV